MTAVYALSTWMCLCVLYLPAMLPIVKILVKIASLAWRAVTSTEKPTGCWDAVHALCLPL